MSTSQAGSFGATIIGFGSAPALGAGAGDSNSVRADELLFGQFSRGSAATLGR
jgi:hypothetical protein